MPGGRIFISYRRGFDNGEARSLYYQLERYFDRNRLFMDVDDIPVGVDFVEHLDEQVAQCQALIAVIGRGWVHPENVERLHSPSDFVRIELDAALKRGSQIPIVPLLLDQMMLPAEDHLPEVLHGLTRRNGVAIEHSSYASTIERRLIPALRRALHEEGTTPAPVTPKGPIPAPAQPTAEQNTMEAASLETKFTRGDHPVWDGATPLHELAPGTKFQEHPDFPKMIEVPEGAFHMGSPISEPDRNEDEGPQRRIRMPKFAVSETTVTFDQWYAWADQFSDIENSDPDDMGWGRQTRPVVNVSWNDAQHYIAWLNTQVEGRMGMYFLPSEVEWEYACRAGTITPYAFGDAITELQARFFVDPEIPIEEQGIAGSTVPVGGLEAVNAWGIRHMHGNVWEWCEDAWHESYFDMKPTADPWPRLGYAEDEEMVVRGGGWSSKADTLRSAKRFHKPANAREPIIGFRVIRTLYPLPEETEETT